MATTKITDLTAYTDPVNTDVLPIVDVTSDVTKKVSIANVMKNASLGTNSLPGISFDGDPNTGIYSPGADQVAVTTGGTQRLLIDSAGAVTIAGDLTVNGTTTNINTQNLVVEDKNIVLGDVTTPTDVTADGGGITLKGTTDKTINWVDSTDAWTSSERFSYPTGSAAAPTLTFTGDANTGIYSPGADQVAISTGGSGRLFVNSSGQVGVGVSPTDLLHIQATNDARLRIKASSSGAGTNSTINLETASEGHWVIQSGNATSSGLRFYDVNASQERLRITSAGLVGVGTSSPATTLDVNGTITCGTPGGVALSIAGGSAIRNLSAAASRMYFDTSFGSATHGSFEFRSSNAGTSRLVIDTSGNVGIGTTAPGQLLQIGEGDTGLGTNVHSVARIEGRAVSGGQQVATLEFNQVTNAPAEFVGASIGIESSASTRSESELVFKVSQATNTNATEAMRLSHDGRLGIGTSGPGGLLHVQSNLAGNNQLILTNIASSNSGAGSEIVFTQGASGFAAGKIQCDREGSYSATTTSQDSALAFFTAADGVDSEKLRITSAGNVGVGTSAPASALDVRGNVNIGTPDASPVSVELGTGATGDRTVFIDFVGDTTYTDFGLRVQRNAGANGGSLISNRGTGALTFQGAESCPFTFVHGPSTERARIDSSGRWLLGTATARSNFQNSTGTAAFQIEGTGQSTSAASIVRNSATLGPVLRLARSAGTTVGSNTILTSADPEIGVINFEGNDGSEFVIGAQISASVDGTPGANDMPGRLVFSTTAGGASSPTERLRITNDGVRGYNQAAPVAVDTTATLTVANLKNGIITSTTAAAVTGTLPTGTLTEGGFSGLYTNFTFEWTVINTGATNNFTVAAGTDHTVVGNMVVAAGNSGRFATRRTAANTFVTYRLSS